MRPTASLVAALLLVAQGAASAQTSTSRLSASESRSQDPAMPTVSPSTHHSMFSRVATGIGAAAVGAWVGFFVSQVALGDWDQAEGRGTINRTVWAGIGGAVGFGIGFSFPIGGRPRALGTSQIGPSSGPGLALPTGKAMISASEISGSGASTAFDIVKDLRSEWLLRRLPHASDTKEEADIAVYLDSQRLGGLDALSTVSAENVRAMYRFTALEATNRWGPGHQEGAILIVTKR